VTITLGSGGLVRRATAALGAGLMAAAVAGAIPASAATTRDLTIVNGSLSPSSYAPNPISAVAGDSLRWTNNGPSPHTVTSVTGDTQAYDSGPIAVTTTFTQPFTVPGVHHYYCSIHNMSQLTTGMYGTVIVQGASPLVLSAVSASSYSLPGSDGATWTDIDVSKLQVAATPPANQSAALRANADLFTDTAGYNQDLGIFVNDSANPSVDTLLAWKESGGFAGVFSPNAAYVQSLYSMTAGHNYIFKLKWKTNKNAPGVTIYAGAGSGTSFPTRSATSLLVESFPVGVTPIMANKANFSSLASSDGSTWQPMDATLSTGTLSPGSNATELLGANADLFTDTAGYNQDIGIFVSVDGATATLVAWKESGGFAGVFSPNAAYVKEIYPMTGGHTYNFSLYWKTNKPASGVTIYAGAGSGSGLPSRSPTSLLAETLAAGANPYSAVKTNFSSLGSSDGTAWQLMDAALNVTVPGADNTNAVLGANADLYTDTTGYNQDVGLFVNDSANPSVDTLLAWKESGGFAGVFSPNAAYLESSFPLASGHTYVFKLKWKTNKNATGVTIYAGAGSGGTFPSRSQTTVVAQLTN
jgi:plastocyanin